MCLHPNGPCPLGLLQQLVHSTLEGLNLGDAADSQGFVNVHADEYDDREQLNSMSTPDLSLVAVRTDHSTLCPPKIEPIRYNASLSVSTCLVRVWRGPAHTRCFPRHVRHKRGRDRCREEGETHHDVDQGGQEWRSWGKVLHQEASCQRGDGGRPCDSRCLHPRGTYWIPQNTRVTPDTTHATKFREATISTGNNCKDSRASWRRATGMATPSAPAAKMTPWAKSTAYAVAVLILVY
jgi:hypothetical protein